MHQVGRAVDGISHRSGVPCRRSQGVRQFGKWQKDPDKDRYYCEYYYPDKMDTTQTDTQICIYYPDDDAKKNYYYFANKSNKIGGDAFVRRAQLLPQGNAVGQVEWRDCRSAKR